MIIWASDTVYLKAWYTSALQSSSNYPHFCTFLPPDWEYLMLYCVHNTYHSIRHNLSFLFSVSYHLAHWIILLTRYHAENRNVTFGDYKFGPLFMRLCYELDLEESALELIKDQVIVSWLLSLTMWFPCAEHWMFLVILTKTSLLPHIIPGFDFQSKAAGLKESALICILRFPWSPCYEKGLDLFI